VAGELSKLDLTSISHYLIIALLFTLSLTVFYQSASDFTRLEIERGGRGYVSDEVWYVSSARNILYKIFHVEPRLSNGSYGATIIYEGYINSFRLKADARDLNISVRADYSKLKGFYVVAPSEESFNAYLSRIREYVNVTDIVPGWMLPDAERVNEYINWEHPPVGKYFVAASIWLLGDYPLHWRLPAILTGALTVTLTYLLMLSLTGNQAVSLTASLLLMLDPLSKALASIMLLDVYVAFFTVLTTLLAVKGLLKHAMIAAVVGGTFKFSALFLLLPVVFLTVRRDVRSKPSFTTLISSLILNIMLAGALFLALTTLVSLPIASYMGFSNWVKYSLIGSFTWHTSVKCTGANCPISSAPWEWFMSVNSFPLYIYPDGSALKASGTWPFWISSLTLSITLAPACFKDRRFGRLWVFYIGVFSGYLLLWAVGGRSQYSFYSIQLAPLVYSTLVYAVPSIIFNRGLLIETLGYWGRLKELILKAVIA
jgi:predicted membrane-bound dolichyl-phosphate-mannose-protein mannosyltransferase